MSHDDAVAAVTSLRTARIAGVMLWLDKRRIEKRRSGSGVALRIANWLFWRSVEADVRSAERAGTRSP